MMRFWPVLGLLLVPASARADDIDRCVAAAERGQAAQRNQSYREARSALTECSDARCPAVVRASCVEWLDQVNRAEPSIVLSITTEDGSEASGAVVEIDKQGVATGTPITIAPGMHQLEAHAEGFNDFSLSFEVREGERDRAFRVKLTRKSAVRPPPTKVESQPTEAAARPIPTITWVTGGVAALGVAGFVGLAWKGTALRDEYRDTCGERCPSSNREEVQTYWLVADLSLVSAAIFGAVSVYTFFTR